jgi:desulfoferrodoxin (superoxide reductase-like protein)
MPTISMFFGIVVYMYLADNKQHHLPHIHTRYQGQKASISIETGDVLDGDIPATKLRLVQAWIEIHREDLMADWELAINNELPFKIPPLQ